MRLLDKYFVTFPRSPDEPAAPEPVAEPVAAVEPEPAPAPEPTPEPAPVVAAKPIPQMVPVAVVADLRSKNRNLESRAQEAERRAADAEALAARLTKGDKPPAADPAPRPPAAPQSDDEGVNRRAEYLVFQRDVAAVRDAGMAQYGQQFTDTIRALAAYGADDDAFVSQALAVARGNNVPAHVLLHELAQDGEKTVSLVGMQPTQRIAALTRMAMAQAELKPAADPKPADPKPVPEPKPAVSRAPAPKPALAPVAAAPEVDPMTPEGNEKMSDKEFEDWYRKTYMRRTG